MMPLNMPANLAFAAPVSQEALGVGIVVFVLVLLGSRLIWPRMPGMLRLGLWSVAFAGVAALVLLPAAQPNDATTIAAPQTVASVPPASGTIAWAVSNMVVEFAPSTGKQATYLRFPAGSLVQNVARSPDGKWFAVTYTPAATGSSGIIDLYVVASDGSSLRLLLSHQDAGGGLAEPAWSADGQFIYATVRGATPTDTWIVRVPQAGGPQQKIADNAASPTLSRDGKSLFFVHLTVTADPSVSYAELWRASPDGTGAQALKGSRFAAIDSPAVSPNGKVVAFAASGQPQAERSSGFRLPRLGPRGASAHGGNWEIWTISRDGGKPERKSSVAEARLEVAWSPDGKHLAATADLGLYVVDPSKNRTDLVDLYTGFGLVWYEK